MRVVAVMWGGPGLEHDVSRLSGEQVLANLDPERYDPVAVHVRPDGAWQVGEQDPAHPAEAILRLRERGVDAAFIAMHGPYGEDGTIQGFLEASGIRYAGSGVAGSALACDKIHAKDFLAAHGVVVAPHVTIPPLDAPAAGEQVGFPAFVKHPHEGSSLGMRRVRDGAELTEAVQAIGRGCRVLMVEAAVEGRELTAGVLESDAGAADALPLVLIEPQGGFFDFESKYNAGGARKLVPAPLDGKLTTRIQETALKIHRLLDLAGMSRSDFILRPDGEFVFLEVNTIPGLTPTSLLPLAAAAAGVSFRELLTRLLERSLRGPAEGE